MGLLGFHEAAFGAQSNLSPDLSSFFHSALAGEDKILNPCCVIHQPTSTIAMNAQAGAGIQEAAIREASGAASFISDRNYDKAPITLKCQFKRNKINHKKPEIDVHQEAIISVGSLELSLHTKLCKEDRPTLCGWSDFQHEFWLIYDKERSQPPVASSHQTRPCG